MLEGVGLTEHTNKLVHQPLHLWPRHQRQRLAIAAALLADPDVIVRDDPFQGLDDAGTDWVKYLLRSLATAGKTVLVALDRVQDLENTADQVLARIFQQPLVAEGTERTEVPVSHGIMDLSKVPIAHT